MKQLTVSEGKLIEYDMMGNFSVIADIGEILKMMIPVQCNHCGKTYDLCSAKVVHRYADCTQFKTPCCDSQADDRTWKSIPDFKRIYLSKISV